MTTADQDPDDDIIEVRAVAAERLTFFVDAVIAIALTLLALDLPVPSGNTNSEVLRSALDHYDDYLAFGISFAVIAARWNEHHRMFRYVHSLGGRLTGLTMLWLFTMVVTPFATRVITGDDAFQVRFGFYAVIQILSSLIYGLMLREVRREHLYVSSIPNGMFSQTALRTAGIIFGFAISIPVSFFTQYSYLCWIAIPFLLGLAHRFQRGPGVTPV